ncbi:MAG: metallophosphoesterase, partial [Selenomonadaceae bacterium]|nr:metallophosphoesterase [Selenomonadaceae bacterium]
MKAKTKFGGATMTYRRILVIGDMHGKFTRLLSLFHKIEFDERQDFLIL